MKIYNAGNRVMNTYLYQTKDGFVMIDTGYENNYSKVSAKYSCGFSNLLDSSIIVNER